MDPWDDILRCAACWALRVDQPLTRRGEHRFCPACRDQGRRRVSVSEIELQRAWSRKLAALHLDRLALAGGDGVLRSRNADQPARYLALADALDELQALPPEDHVWLVGALAHRALWDGASLVVAWRQPFDFFVDAGVSVMAAPATDLAEIERLSEQVAERLAAAVADALAEDGRRGRQARLRQLGPCNVLTVNDAIAELGMGKEEGREWLEAKGLIHHPGRPRRGSGRVIVSELIEALKTTRGRPGSRRMAPTKLPLPKTDRF